MQNKTLTIMFVDVQGYTSMTAQQTRDEQQLFAKEINAFIEKNVTEKMGKLVKTMGDGFLSTFESPTDAISCGKNMLVQIERRNASIMNENNFISVRIGISTGEVGVDETGDVFGDAVNIAARIQKFAEPNEVFISETTYLAMNKAEIRALDLGPQKFKNVLQEVRVFKILKDDKTGPGLIKQPKATPWLLILLIFLVMAGIVIIIVSDFFKLNTNRRPPQQEQRIEKVPVKEQVKEQLREEIKQELKAEIKQELKGNIQERKPLTREEFQNLSPEERQKIIQRMQRRRAMMNQSQPAMDTQQQQQKPLQQQQGNTWNKLCGDGICDAAEQANPNLCPKDCTNDNPNVLTSGTPSSN